MKSITDTWARANPGAALASGCEVDLAGSALFASNRDVILRELRDALADHRRSASEQVILSASYEVVALATPSSQLREVLECIRALVYLDRLGTPTADEIDILLARCIDESVMTLGRSPAPLILEILAKQIAGAINKVASDARLLLTARAAAAAEVTGPTIPDEVGWEFIGSISSDRLGTLVASDAHARLLLKAYGFERPIHIMDHLADIELDGELHAMSRLSRSIATRCGIGSVRAEDVAQWLEDHRGAGGTIFGRATSMAAEALSCFDETLIRLSDDERQVRPEPTPSAMLSLVTEGEEYLVGGLTPHPRAHCFITEKKCGSAYTLANVVYHELAHCWNMLKCCRAARDLPPPMRVAGTFGSALLEGIATLREWEVYELFAAGRHLGEYGGVFEYLGIPRDVQCEEFEFDTRYWRVARLIRALFDFRVHSGQQSYVEFVMDMSRRTGLSQSRVHGFCFSFFEKPGYAPCYAIGALELAGLQQELMSSGMSRREFNTRASSIGMVPPAFWRQRIVAG